MKNKLEETEKVIANFVESWNDIENFYKTYPDDNRPFKNDALRLIKKMRNLGLDKELRVGQALWFFILSRNRHHGLDQESHVQITFLGKNKMTVNSSFNGEEKSHDQEVKYDGFLKEMIQELLKGEIVWNKDYTKEPDTLFDEFD